LNPVVIIGNGGLTPGVMAEIDRCLKAHELIKVRVGGADRAERETMNINICAAIGAAPVQHLGKILVIYRERPEIETITPPRKPLKKDIGSGGRIRKPPAGRAKTGRKASTDGKHSRNRVVKKPVRR
jgi:putative YhbY family RNA-binding protein